jgi:hypothetical protein
MTPPSDIDEDAPFELPPPMIPFSLDGDYYVEDHTKDASCVAQEKKEKTAFPLVQFDAPAPVQPSRSAIMHFISQLSTEAPSHQEPYPSSSVGLRKHFSSFDDAGYSESPEMRALRFRGLSSCSTVASTPRKDSLMPSFCLRKVSDLQSEQPTCEQKESARHSELSVLLASF